MEIECIQYRPTNVGAFVGFADLYIKNLGIEIYGCTVYSKDGKRWVNLPARAYKGKDGEEKYAKIVRFKEKADFQSFYTLAKDAVDRYTMAQAVSDGQPN